MPHTQLEDGKRIEWEDTPIESGGDRDVYRIKNDSSYLTLLRESSPTQVDRYKAIVQTYGPCVMSSDISSSLFLWPSDWVEVRGQVGFISRGIPTQFLFKTGSTNNDALALSGKPREATWYTGRTVSRLDPGEKSDWRMTLSVCLQLTRAVRALEAAGLAHASLAARNLLVDPRKGTVLLIDIMNLVVPGRLPPDLAPMRDSSAPEIVRAFSSRSRQDVGVLSQRYTLSVLIYMLLLRRHPLRGPLVRDADPAVDEVLAMGEQALFIEHPVDARNRPDPLALQDADKLWGDVDRLPFEMTGSFLSPLILRAFKEGLHDPHSRPITSEWIPALQRTIEALRPCANPDCEQKWYVPHPNQWHTCHFCESNQGTDLPYLKMWLGADEEERMKLEVYDGRYVFPWNLDAAISPHPKMDESQKKPVGYFRYHRDQWLYVGLGQANTEDASDPAIQVLEPGKRLELAHAGRTLYRAKFQQRHLQKRSAVPVPERKSVVPRRQPIVFIVATTQTAIVQSWIDSCLAQLKTEPYSLEAIVLYLIEFNKRTGEAVLTRTGVDLPEAELEISNAGVKGCHNWKLTTVPALLHGVSWGERTYAAHAFVFADSAESLQPVPNFQALERKLVPEDHGGRRLASTWVVPINPDSEHGLAEVAHTLNDENQDTAQAARLIAQDYLPHLIFRILTPVS